MITIKPNLLTQSDIQRLRDFFKESELNVWEPNTPYVMKNGVTICFEHMVSWRYSEFADADKYDFISNDPIGHGPTPDAKKLAGTLTLYEKSGWKFHASKNWFLSDKVTFQDEVKHEVMIGEKTWYLINPFNGLDIMDLFFETARPLTDFQRLELCFLIIEEFKKQVLDKNVVHQELTSMNVFVAFEPDEGMRVRFHNISPTKPKLDFYYAAPELIKARRFPTDNISNLYSLGRVLAQILGVDTSTYQNLTRAAMLATPVAVKLKDLFYQMTCLTEAQKNIISVALTKILDELPENRGTFEELATAFDSVFPAIDPTQASEDDSKKLFKLLNSSISAPPDATSITPDSTSRSHDLFAGLSAGTMDFTTGKRFWPSHEIYTIDNISFRLKYPVLKRPCKSLKHQGEFRYECIGSGIFGAGGTAKILPIRGTISLNGAQSFFSTKKPRLVKDAAVDPHSLMLFANVDIPHLKAKPVVEFKRHHMLVLKHIQGKELFDTIITNGRYNSLSKDFALSLARAVVIAYQHQVFDLGRHHCDVKLPNILINITDAGIDATFVDYDFSIPIGTKIDLNCGTEDYVAPEILDGDSPSIQSEIYAFGLVLKHIFNCVSDFDKETSVRVKQFIETMRAPSRDQRLSSFDSILPFLDSLNAPQSSLTLTP